MRNFLIYLCLLCGYRVVTHRVTGRTVGSFSVSITANNKRPIALGLLFWEVFPNRFSILLSKTETVYLNGEKTQKIFDFRKNSLFDFTSLFSILCLLPLNMGVGGLSSNLHEIGGIPSSSFSFSYGKSKSSREKGQGENDEKNFVSIVNNKRPIALGLLFWEVYFPSGEFLLSKTGIVYRISEKIQKILLPFFSDDSPYETPATTQDQTKSPLDPPSMRGRWEQ